MCLNVEREKSIKHGESPVEPISSCRDEHGFVPTVGRWGSEWPSWLETEEIWYQPQGQARGPWIRGVPLPLPVWAHYESPALTVSTVEQYEELAGSVELETQRLLREHRYDTIGNFLRYLIEFLISSSTIHNVSCNTSLGVDYAGSTRLTLQVEKVCWIDSTGSISHW